MINEHVVCSCLPSYIGSAPNCRPECVVSSECSQNRACINMKCADPCINACGQNSRCQVVNHNPICSCSPGYTGDPFIRCVSQRKCIVHECTCPPIYLFFKFRMPLMRMDSEMNYATVVSFVLEILSKIIVQTMDNSIQTQFLNGSRNL